MARWLTPGRTLLVMLAAGLLLGASVRPDIVQLGQRSYSSLPESDARHKAVQAASHEFARWRAVAIADSVVRSLAAGLPEDKVLVGASMPEELGVALRRVVAASPPATDTGAGSFVVVAVLDTLSSFESRPVTESRFYPSVGHILPVRDGDPCLTIVVAGRGWHQPASARRFERALRGEVPGTCGIVASFGLPGPHIREWLAATGGVPAATHSASLHPPLVEGTSGVSIMDFVWFGALELQLEAGCFAGKEDACAEWMTQPLPEAAKGHLSLDGLDLLLVSRHWRTQTPRSFASDLILLHGPEKFAAFWSSELPVDEAFRQAYGQSLSSHVSRWVRGMGLGDIRELRSPRRAVAPILSMMLLALGASLLYASRRTVSA